MSYFGLGVLGALAVGYFGLGLTSPNPVRARSPPPFVDELRSPPGCRKPASSCSSPRRERAIACSRTPRRPSRDVEAGLPQAGVPSFGKSRGLSPGDTAGRPRGGLSRACPVPSHKVLLRGPRRFIGAFDPSTGSTSSTSSPNCTWARARIRRPAGFVR
jgi:hypothetical protein